MLIFQSVVLCNGNIGNHQGGTYSTGVLSYATYQQIGRIYVCKTSKVYQSFITTHLLILSYGIIIWTLPFTDHFPYQLLQDVGHQQERGLVNSQKLGVSIAMFDS